MRAASMQSTGRRRLPPAKTLWRMARWIEEGVWFSAGMRRSSARSVSSAPQRRVSFTSTSISIMLNDLAAFLSGEGERQQGEERGDAEASSPPEVWRGGVFDFDVGEAGGDGDGH